MFGAILDFQFTHRYYNGIQMTTSPNTSVLAIDGGGTRCRCALERSDGRIVVETGSANAYTDFDGTIHQLQNGIRSLAEQANTPIETLCDLPAFVGLAGVTGDAVVARLTAALPLRNVRYADDRLAAARGALGRDDGVIAHCGTGSFFAAQINGNTRFAGGWGAILGDEASAQWIGRKALTRILRHVDGFDQSSALSDEILARFKTAHAIVVFARTAKPAELGALAPLVTKHAETGDPIAMAILQSGADHIATDLRQMGWALGVGICLTGGIGQHYAPYLSDDMKDALTQPLGTPLDGAISLARDMELKDGHF